LLQIIYELEQPDGAVHPGRVVVAASHIIEAALDALPDAPTDGESATLASNDFHHWRDPKLGEERQA